MEIKNMTNPAELTPHHPFYTATDFFKQRVGCKLIKLTIDGGFTCPNRDGTLSSDGCIFCSGSGSGDFAPERTLPISEQIELMKQRLSAKWGKHNSYMAYFQAFTNTYAPVDRLRELYTEALNCDDVIALSVATRPDCISREVCELLSELSQRAYVCVELGLQTASDKTAQLINRCYPTEVYISAMGLLKEYGIDVITHVILGLPGETEDDMLTTVKLACDCGTAGIKLQLLHILKGTRLAELYFNKPFEILTYEKYISLVVDIIERTPPNVSVHRITGDGSKVLLTEPRWSLDKRRVLNGIHQEFIKRKSYQGIITSKFT
jgi:hypothetical protein